MSTKPLAFLSGMILFALPCVAAPADKIPAHWIGRYQASVISASSGFDGDQTTVFGKDRYRTTMNLRSLACVDRFEMSIDAYGKINGNGRIMYIYQGTANNAVTAVMPGAAPLANTPYGLNVNLRDGKQFRDWTFSGQVSANGEVVITGIPEQMMERLNVGRWEKQRPWSALMPPDKNSMRGPFKFQLTESTGKVPGIRLDQFMQLDDALIKRVRYRANIFRSDARVVPACQGGDPEVRAQCAASEYLKVKANMGVDGFFTASSSRDLGTGAVKNSASTGGKESQNIGVDDSGNISWDMKSPGLLVGSSSFSPATGAYSMSIGIGIDTSKVAPSALKLTQKIELVYDSACGLGIKGSIKQGVAGTAVGLGVGAGAAVEGAIFFTRVPRRRFS